MNIESVYCCGEIFKCGYLFKKSGVLKKWKFGYFVFEKNCLCCYGIEKEWIEGVFKEVIFFNNILVYILNILSYFRYCIKIVKRICFNKIVFCIIYFLCCLCEEERNKWLYEILYVKVIILLSW